MHKITFTDCMNFQILKQYFLRMQEKVSFFFLIFSYASLNALVFLSLSSSVAHQTGNLFKSTLYFFEAVDSNQSLNLPLFLLLAFFLGATCSVYLWNTEKPRRLALFYVVQSLLALILGFYFENSIYLVIFISFCMGVQNALGYRVDGLLLRKTHITGLLTDFGIQLGCVLQGKKESVSKFFLCFQALLMFVCGIIAGASLYRQKIPLKHIFLLLSVMHLGIYLYRSVVLWKNQTRLY